MMTLKIASWLATKKNPRLFSCRNDNKPIKAQQQHYYDGSDIYRKVLLIIMSEWKSIQHLQRQQQQEYQQNKKSHIYFMRFKQAPPPCSSNLQLCTPSGGYIQFTWFTYYLPSIKCYQVGLFLRSVRLSACWFCRTDDVQCFRTNIN